MGSITDKAADVYRDAKVAGVPASGANEPVKREIRELFSLVDLATAAAQAGITTVANTGARDTFYATEANRNKLVYVNNNNGSASDPANGVYEYVDGASRIAQGFYQGVTQLLVDARLNAIVGAYGNTLLPTELLNGGFNPALPPPQWAFGGFGAPPIVDADSVFQAEGIARVARVAAGGSMYIEVTPDRLPFPGDWIAASLHIAVPSADAWASLAGRMAVKIIKPGGSYAPGDSTDILFDVAQYEMLDATHRHFSLVAQVPSDSPAGKLSIFVNLGGLGFGVDVGAPAYASATVKPVGVAWSRPDPFGVERLKTVSTVPSIYIAGDSLTDGTGASGADKKLDARIAYYLGGMHSALGVPGSYSGQIVDREVGVPLQLENNRLDSDGETVITGFRGKPIIGVSGAPDSDGNGFPDWSNQPLTSPATGRVIERRFIVAGVVCTMRRTGTPSSDVQTTSEDYRLIYPAVSAPNTFVSATDLTARAVPPSATFLGLWAGTNDRFVPDTVVANVIRWFDAYAGTKRFVLTPTCGASEPLGSILGERVRQIAARLGEQCGAYAIDTISSLLAKGLISQGLTANGEDYSNAANGVIPSRLRSDDVHLNDAGYDALAQIVVSNFVAWGWIERAQLAHVPLLMTL